MKVVFLENVPGVARAGEVREVSGGFGRNYLLPRRLAVLATPAQLKRLEQEHEIAARREARLGTQARDLAEQIGQQTVVITARVGQQGRLYGSVTGQQIVEAVSQLVGQTLDRRRLELEEPIRKLGTYQIPLQVTKEVRTTVTVIVQGPRGERAPEALPQAGPAEEAVSGAEPEESEAASPEGEAAVQE